MAATRKVIGLGKLFILVALCSLPALATPNATGQTCNGGNSTGTTITTIACSASMTVSANNEIVCVGTLGVSVSMQNLTSASHTGTAAITWHVENSLNGDDTTDGQQTFGFIGLVTGGGTATPAATWGTAVAFDGIQCAEFSGTQDATDGITATFVNPGSSATNGDASGTITTATNGDLLVSEGLDATGVAGTTYTAGTTSVTFSTVGTCPDSTSGANLCMEWGVQTTAGAGTKAAWTLNKTNVVVVSVIAIKAASTSSPAPPTLQTMGVGD